MHDDFFLFLLCWCKLKDLKKKKLQLMLMMKRRMQIRTRNYVTLDCLRAPHDSDWIYLYNNGTNANFISVISLDRAAFNNLVIKFSNFYQVKSGPGKIGRPRRLLHKSQALGCILAFYSDKMGYKTLCQMFGIPMASLSRVIKQAEDALLLALKSEPDAQIRWPSLDQQVSWAQRVQAKHPLVTGRWGFIDGKNLRVQKPSDAELQNAMYNGWLHSTLVTGTICFGFVCLYIYIIRVILLLFYLLFLY